MKKATLITRQEHINNDSYESMNQTSKKLQSQEGWWGGGDQTEEHTLRLCIKMVFWETPDVNMYLNMRVRRDAVLVMWRGNFFTVCACIGVLMQYAPIRQVSTL